MFELPDSLKNSIEAISRLPGIGKKSAARISLSIAGWNDESLDYLAESLLKLKNIRHCNNCKSYSDNDLCSICLDNSRDKTIICVVETISDLMAIEKSGNFNGSYFVLHGVINPLAGIGPDELSIHDLLDIINKNDVCEVILAINPSIEGDATCSYLKQVFPESVDTKRIGFGVPIGGTLEYLDPLTISKAFENKKRL